MLILIEPPSTEQYARWCERSVIELRDTFVPATGYQLESNQEIFKNSDSDGHYIIFQGISSARGEGSGFGVLETSWDVYYQGDINQFQESDSASLNTKYNLID